MTKSETEHLPFFFNPLRSRLLISFFAAHLFLAGLIGTVFAFAPDEGGYLTNFTNLYKPDFRNPALVGWQQAPIFALRLIYAPASIAHLLGIPSYLAIRLLSILTSAGAIYLVMCAWKSFGNRAKRIRKDILVVGCIPSLFLWMTLGLRESFIFLALSLICAGMLLTGREKLGQGLILEFLGFWLLLNVKNYLFVIAVLSVAIQLVLQRILRGKFVRAHTYPLLLAIVLPMAIYPPSAKLVTVSIWSSIRPGSANLISDTGTTPTPSPSPTPTTIGSGKVNAPGKAGEVFVPSVADPGVTLSALSAELNAHPNSIFSKVLNLLGVTKLIPEHLVSIATPASTLSGSTSSKMNISRAHLRDPVGIIKNSTKFLLLPIPFYQNGSLFLNVLSYEAPFWWILYLSFGVAVLRFVRRRNFDPLGLFVIAFSSLFVLFSSLTEVNVGTLIRHRSVLVIPILFLLIMQPKQETQLK